MEHRGYKIGLSENGSLYEIRHTGKGSLPKVMEGRYTKVGLAVKIIDDYLDKKKPVATKE